MSLEQGLGRASLALALLGPAGGAVALMFGEVALWQGPALRPLPPDADAGVYLGTWATLACLGLLAASPFRFAAAVAIARRSHWRWAALAAAAVVGCADLSFGAVLAALTVLLWRRAGPGDGFAPGRPNP